MITRIQNDGSSNILGGTVSNDNAIAVLRNVQGNTPRADLYKAIKGSGGSKMSTTHYTELSIPNLDKNSWAQEMLKAGKIFV